jgi:hypothetical protein
MAMIPMAHDVIDPTCRVVERFAGYAIEAIFGPRCGTGRGIARPIGTICDRTPWATLDRNLGGFNAEISAAGMAMIPMAHDVIDPTCRVVERFAGYAIEATTASIDRSAPLRNGAGHRAADRNHLRSDSLGDFGSRWRTTSSTRRAVSWSVSPDTQSKPSLDGLAGERRDNRFD